MSSDADASAAAAAAIAEKTIALGYDLLSLKVTSLSRTRKREIAYGCLCTALLDRDNEPMGV
ncbi:hypothetical protein D9757_003306 [Collybiopsis confluens]|uniref:Uncharacterized protein n=1 Tax=Collybiopsis confluens TaxID=2823264 RepID=A0A8H5MFD9_9AGAR|nr:hypothetical protein D9757_003306 [Collybiopsis confluens]